MKMEDSDFFFFFHDGLNETHYAKPTGAQYQISKYKTLLSFSLFLTIKIIQRRIQYYSKQKLHSLRVNLD